MSYFYVESKRRDGTWGRFTHGVLEGAVEANKHLALVQTEMAEYGHSPEDARLHEMSEAEYKQYLLDANPAARDKCVASYIDGLSLEQVRAIVEGNSTESHES